MFHWMGHYSLLSLGLLFLVYYSSMVFSVGLTLSSGLLIPSILSGTALALAPRTLQSRLVPIFLTRRGPPFRLHDGSLRRRVVFAVHALSIGPRHRGAHWRRLHALRRLSHDTVRRMLAIVTL